MMILVTAIRNWMERRPGNWDDEKWFQDVMSAPSGADSFSDRELGQRFLDSVADECQEDGPDWGPGVQVLLPMLQDMGVGEVTAVGRSVRKFIFIKREEASR